MNNGIKVDDWVKDITGKTNNGQPMQVTKLIDDQAEVMYLEGPEQVQIFEFVVIKNLQKTSL
jgi:hypothetical protein